jgi:uncharacterized protein YdiU (UPF0061 family)
VEAAISAAVAGDLAPFERLHAALADPFAEAPGFADLEAAPEPAERVHATFCGT